MSPPHARERPGRGAPQVSAADKQKDRREDTRHPVLPVCRFCAGSGHGPVDTREGAAAQRVAAMARLALGNDVFDWSGRERKRGGVTVLSSVAARYADAVRERGLDDDELKRVVVAVAGRHGRDVAQQLLAHLGRAAVA